MKHIADVIVRLASKRIFIKIDLLTVFHQIPTTEVENTKPAIITSFYLYQFLVMTLGLTNVAQFFERFLHSVHLLSSESPKQYAQYLRMLFERLNSHSSVINVAKCILGV